MDNPKVVTPIVKGKAKYKKSRLLSIGKGLKISTSNIPGAGNGLFISPGFKIQKNAIFTWYQGVDDSGEYMYSRSDELPHLVRTKDNRRQDSHWAVMHYQFSVVRGITVPQLGAGGGSFANDPLNRYLYNATLITMHEAEFRGIYLKALEDIESGQEIFINYGLDYWAKEMEYVKKYGGHVPRPWVPGPASTKSVSPEKVKQVKKIYLDLYGNQQDPYKTPTKSPNSSPLGKKRRILSPQSSPTNKIIVELETMPAQVTEALFPEDFEPLSADIELLEKLQDATNTDIQFATPLSLSLTKSSPITTQSTIDEDDPMFQNNTPHGSPRGGDLSPDIQTHKQKIQAIDEISKEFIDIDIESKKILAAKWDIPLSYTPVTLFNDSRPSSRQSEENTLDETMVMVLGQRMLLESDVTRQEEQALSIMNKNLTEATQVFKYSRKKFGEGPVTEIKPMELCERIRKLTTYYGQPLDKSELLSLNKNTTTIMLYWLARTFGLNQDNSRFVDLTSGIGNIVFQATVLCNHLPAIHGFETSRVGYLCSLAVRSNMASMWEMSMDHVLFHNSDIENPSWSLLSYTHIFMNDKLISANNYKRLYEQMSHTQSQWKVLVCPGAFSTYKGNTEKELIYQLYSTMLRVITVKQFKLGNSTKHQSYQFFFYTRRDSGQVKRIFDAQQSMLSMMDNNSTKNQLVCLKNAYKQIAENPSVIGLDTSIDLPELSKYLNV